MIHVFGRAVRPPTQLTRLVLLGTLSVLLMILDHRSHQLDRIRGALTVLATPLHYLAELPVRAGGGVGDFFTARDTLRAENERLRADQELMRARLLQFEALEAENGRMREMLGSAARVADKALAAELIQVSSEPFTRRIMLARGARDGVFTGQPVIDAHGVMGQVTQVAPHTSHATLITDPGHAIPVLVNRNGLRALVFGTGAPDTVRVPYLAASADIREGDLLVSSGMGGVFPPGYPVAEITRIINDPDEPFLEVRARPAARINHSKQVLLIWPGSKLAKPEPPAAREPRK